MLVTQVYEIMNTVHEELTGETAVVLEDLTNVIDLGDTFLNAQGLDNYVRTLNDVIGRMVFKDRIYEGRAPSVMMDGWEYGSIMEKISADLPDATENESWELEDGASYDPNIFTAPTVSVKCWNKRITFEIPMSITEKQVKSSFNSATQLNAFITMIYNAISNSMTMKFDSLIMRTINNMIAETFNDDYGATDETVSSHIKTVNLLYLYNEKFTKTLSAAASITDPDFIKFASLTMANYIDRLNVMSTLFNMGGKERFTSDSDLHVIMLSEFKNAANTYLQSDTFNEKYTALPNAEKVAYWQGSGLDYGFASTSKIHVKTSAGNTVELSGVLCTMFDNEALGVTNMNQRVKNQYNAKGEFWNEWHKYDAGYFNDSNENMVVFFVA
jgi:hypothetical protein